MSPKESNQSGVSVHTGVALTEFVAAAGATVVAAAVGWGVRKSRSTWLSSICRCDCIAAVVGSDIAADNSRRVVAL